MKIALAALGKSFATRDRARAIVHQWAGCDARPISLDVSGVDVSPAFLAELLTALTATNAVEVTGGDDSRFNLDMAQKLVRQLGLGDLVSVSAETTAGEESLKR